jgi:membrane-associated protease RseP (regulator of RpoE activity)
MVSGQLDGVPGEFEIDTGSRGALTVMHPFAVTNGLIDKYHATRSVTAGYGVGGPSKVLLARASKLTLGALTIDSPVTEFAIDTGGAAAAARTAGNIGGDLLKRFTVTLDYAHQTMWLQPNALSSQPEVFDRSGLWIMRAKGGGIQVADVAPDSAAAKAGLVIGDEIVSVNDKLAKEVPLYALREDLKGAVGTRFKLQVKGKSGERSVALTLANQV